MKLQTDPWTIVAVEIMLKIAPQILNRKTFNGYAESLSCVNAPEGISRVSSRGGRTRQHVGDLQVVSVADPNDRVGAADDGDPSADRSDRTFLGRCITACTEAIG